MAANWKNFEIICTTLWKIKKGRIIKLIEKNALQNLSANALAKTFMHFTVISYIAKLHHGITKLLADTVAPSLKIIKNYQHFIFNRLKLT